jgi:hypothetical protein
MENAYRRVVNCAGTYPLKTEGELDFMIAVASHCLVVRSLKRLRACGLKKSARIAQAGPPNGCWRDIISRTSARAREAAAPACLELPGLVPALELCPRDNVIDAMPVPLNVPLYEVPSQPYIVYLNKNL